MEAKGKVLFSLSLLVSILLIIFFLNAYISNKVKDTIMTDVQKKSRLTLGSANLKGELADSQFSILNKISHFAFCSLQEVRIKKYDWKLGEVEIFKPVLNKHPFLLAMVAKRMVNELEDVKSCFGVYLNPNSGFHYTNHSVHYAREKEENVIILVFGKFGVNDFIFGAVHGEWDLENGGYNNQANMDAVTRALEDISKKRPKYYIIMGDFNIKYSVMVDYLNNKWRKILPDITLENGPRFTCFDQDGFANPDHILTNIPYKNLNYLFLGGDHLQFSLDIEIDEFKGKKSNLIDLGGNE